MIIKSLSRKAKKFSSSTGKGRGRSPFETLIKYMERGIQDEDGKAVLWHNLYADERTNYEDILREFESNAERLRERKNGNVLYHEILSFSGGYDHIRDDDLLRMIADIGQEYLNARASRQLGYGVIHRNTDHIHLHLMISSNDVGKTDRVRLSKKEFSTVQKDVEAIVLARYPELAQTKIYDKPRAKERLKTDVHEQAMRARTSAPSRKEALKAKMHQLFEQSGSIEEMSRLFQKEGMSFYTRGKSVGVLVRDADGKETKHRLGTLGVEEHYLSSLARFSRPQEQMHPTQNRRAEMPADGERVVPPGGAEKDATSSAVDILKREAEELLRGIPGVGKDKAPENKGKDRDRGEDR
jgi:hypothetical protein